MTKTEFLRAVPDIIEHGTWGYAELEVREDKDGDKIAQYRDRQKASHLGIVAKSWEEVYRKMFLMLPKHGYNLPVLEELQVDGKVITFAIKKSGKLH